MQKMDAFSDTKQKQTNVSAKERYGWGPVKTTEVMKLVGAMTKDEISELGDAWAEFARNPENYAGSVVVDMVKKWLSDYREENKHK